MKRQIGVWGYGMLVGMLCFGWSEQAIAQQALTRAEVYRLQNSVELLLQNQSPRPARLADVLVPRDSLRTSASSIAELLFNEGSIARVDQNTTFYFETGLQRYQLRNLVALNETIFVLEDGAALIISPPGSVGTQIRTPEVRVNIAASEVPNTTASLPVAIASLMPTKSLLSPPVSLELSKFQPQILSQTSPDSDSFENALPPLERRSAAMVVHDATSNTTRVFALTDGDIVVSGLTDNTEVSLLGGQTVAIANGEFSDVQEFDLEAFYRSVPLAAGLGPGQDGYVRQQSEAVQLSLIPVREATLAAVRRQARRLSGFGATFLRDALSGTDSDFNPQRGGSTTVELDTIRSIDGTFVRGADIPDGFSGVFVDAAGNQLPVTVNTENQTVTLGGQTGTSNNAGLSGSNAVGTLVFSDGATIPFSAGAISVPDGQAVRIEVFNVNGDFDNLQTGDSRPGRLTVGRPPDR